MSSNANTFTFELSEIIVNQSKLNLAAWRTLGKCHIHLINFFLKCKYNLTFITNKWKNITHKNNLRVEDSAVSQRAKVIIQLKYILSISMTLRKMQLKGVFIFSDTNHKTPTVNSSLFFSRKYLWWLESHSYLQPKAL